MTPKPAHLGDAYGSQFCDPSVAAAYPHRPPYPKAVFPILTGLIAGTPRTVLDLGAGSGDIARNLAPLVDRVDAIDLSEPMIELGRSLPVGDDPRLRWMHGRAEDVELSPPYALITAGESLHWMQWDRLFPRLRGVLAPGGVLAIIGRWTEPVPWAAAMQTLIDRFSTNRKFRPYDLIDELTMRGLLSITGRAETEPAVTRQSIASYVESFHSRNGFSRDRMPVADAGAFDAGLTAIVTPFVEHGMVTLRTRGKVTWGQPQTGAAG